jgi:hypothetical protein
MVAASPDAAPKSVASSLIVDAVGDASAVVTVGAGCALEASPVAPLYTEVAGQGFIRRYEGLLALKAPAPCVVSDGPPVTITALTVATKAAGSVQLDAAGVDAEGRASSMRFVGALIDEREVSPATEGVVDVHFFGEIATACPGCSVNRRPIGEAGAFPFEPRLERLVPDGGDRWAPICSAPCVASVDAGAHLRVAGVGVRESEPFLLPQGRRRLALKATSPGTAARVFGWGFVAAGTVFVGLGATELAIGAAGGHKPSVDRSLEVGGAIFAASSLAFYIPALIVLSHDHTTVTTDAGERLTSTRATAPSYALIPGGVAF